MPGRRFMGKCVGGNANWMCTQLFGLVDLLQSGYGTLFVRISCFSNLLFWSNTCVLENVTFLVCLEHKSTTKMTAWTMGSFHGFGKMSTLYWYFAFRSHFVWMPPILSVVYKCMKILCSCLIQHVLKWEACFLVWQ